MSHSTDHHIDQGAKVSSPSSAKAPSLQQSTRGTLRSPLRRKGSGARSSRLALLGVLVALVGLAFGATGAFAAPPSFTVDPTPTVSYTSAQVSGTIDPGESEVFYAFQYTAHPETEGWASGPGAFVQTLAAGSGSSNVSEELTGLKPGTKYQLRLWALATDFSQEWTSPEPYVSFQTKPVTAPTVTLDPITTHSDSTAHFSGTVDSSAPAGPLDAAAKAAYKTEWHFECTPECPGLSGGSVEAEEGSQPVSANTTGLEPNTTYEVRLVAENTGGPTTASESFATDLIPASVKTAAGGSDGKGGYILQGIVNPHNSEVSACSFKYGPTGAYGKEVACATMPGAGGKSVEVTAHVSGLTPGASYHFELSATNGAGAASSSDATFLATAPGSEACANEGIREEQHSTFLAECRAYELVTTDPTEGFGTGQITYSDAGAVAYSAFSGNVANSGAGAGSAGNKYVSNRSSTGWHTVADLNGPSGSIYADPEAFSGCGCTAELFSADLRSSVWSMGKTGISDNQLNIYLRKPDGSFALIGPFKHSGSSEQEEAPPGHTPISVGGPGASFVGASADLSHYLLSGEADELGPGLWEYAGTGNSAPRHVDVDNSGESVSGCGVLTNLAGHLANAISSDGNVVFFTALGCPGGPATNEVWARVDGTSSYDASASLCTRTAADPGGACNAAAPAAFEGASVDGSRIFFTTTQQLVNGDTNEGNDLYAYDLPTAADPHPSPALVEVSGTGSEADVEGVVNVADDGSHVYFVAGGVLASNTDALGEPAVSGDHNLYVWERDASHPAGQTTFVGKLDADDACLWGAGPALCLRRAQSTADGRYLLLPTTSPLVASDTDTSQDIYRYDAVTEAMVRVSTNVDGVGGNSEGVEAGIVGLPYDNGTAGYHRLREAISDNGEAIVFSTTEALSPSDTNGASDVYLWKAGRVSLISSGRWSEGAINGTIDASGQNVYFMTAQALTADDGDTVNDVYDARVDGGFGVAQVSSCSGEGCQPVLSEPPGGVGAPASTTLSGAGNSPAPAPVPAKPPVKPLTKAQKLAKALQACRKDKSKRKRASCEAQARKRYGAKPKAKPRKKAQPRKGGK